MKILIAPQYDSIGKNDATKWHVDEIILPSESENWNLPNAKNELILYVPTIINSEVAIEYDGVELAIKLYMAALREKRQNIKIVLMGVESRESFLLNYRYPNVLKCPGFDYILLSLNAVVGYTAFSTDINVEKALLALKDVGIGLPESYVSNHSFINEWCAFSWSKYMGFSCDKLAKTLDSTLYFDYLRTLQYHKEIKISDEKKADIKALKGKILLIDDNEYWHEFFTNFFGENKSNVSFMAIGKDFKNKKAEEIKTECLETVRSFNPDVILLDFRLLEDKDYNVNSRANISGVQVLRALKGTADKPGEAYGTKIIMFTATGKIENIFSLQKFGADGFIFKDSPEQYVGKPPLKESISRMIRLLDDMQKCAILSKEICNSLKKCENIACKYSEDFCSQIKHIADMVRILLQGDFREFQKLKHIYLECFGILETIKRLKESNHSITINDFIQGHTTELDEWNNINNIRNAFAHGGKIKDINGRKDIDPDEDLVVDYLIKLCNFNEHFLDKVMK